MGIFDKAKDLVGKNSDKVADAIDKAADVADDKTGGKYAEHIDTGVDKAKGVVAGLTDEADEADGRA